MTGTDGGDAPRRLVLVLNAGSSSLKYAVVDVGTGRSAVTGRVQRVGTDRASVTHGGEVLDPDDAPAGDLDEALATVHRLLARDGLEAGDLVAVGHRVVHGGARFVEPVLLDDAVVAALDEVTPLAPLHNPPALAAVASARAAYPDLPHGAVFDTAFFADLPPAAATVAIDRDVARRHGVRRFGAHGTSHAYVASAAAAHLGRDLGDPGDLRLVTLHLGNGASAAAVRGGRPVDTSMGLTPLDGLVMGTRGGDVDPGVLLHLLDDGMTADELADLLHHRSGLQGLAGASDFRDVLAAADGDPDAPAGLDAGAARTAYDVWVHRARRYLGGYLAVLGGADAVVLTGGVGEHVPRARADVLGGLEALGIRLDADRNARTDAPDRPVRISADGSPVAALVVPTDEELAIARQVAALVG